MSPQTAEAPSTQTKGLSSRPWLWLPSLYFSQGVPYVIVMTLSVVMYKRLGVSNTDIALYTSWLYLPWVVKPLWSPLVDITRTKRSWVISMQLLVSVALALVAFSVTGSSFFRWSLALFWLMAFCSATHDIAADGFYMLSLTKHEQAWWVGLRSTFYRTAMIVGSGLLVVLAGVLESKNGLPQVLIPVKAVTAAATASTDSSITVSTSQTLRILTSPEELQIPITDATAGQAKTAIEQAKAWNREHGFIEENPPAPPKVESWWSRNVSDPLGRLWQTGVSGPLGRVLKQNFAKTARSAAVSAGNVGVLQLHLSAAPPSGQSIVVTVDRQKSGMEFFGLAKGDKGFRLLEGERLVFSQLNWSQPGRVVVQLDPKLRQPATIILAASSGNLPLAWSITLFTVAGLFLAFTLWHTFMLPRPVNDGPVVGNRGWFGEFGTTLASFFRKPNILLSLSFILLYRFDEAQLAKVISPFLLDARESGGLGLTTSQVGLVYGTFGILALTCGGLLGGFLSARHGLRRMLPFMVCSMYLPKLVFVALSHFQPENFLITSLAVAVEQFGYGFGFTAYMLYLLYFADGPHKTAHYAICTGFMALGMMVPGMWSGWLADLIGYQRFFVWVVFSAIPGLILALLLRVEPTFGKKSA